MNSDWRTRRSRLIVYPWRLLASIRSILGEYLLELTGKTGVYDDYP